MRSILGISAYYHDSAAALLIDGQIVAAAQEERFSRKKHDASFPRLAIDYCLKHAGLSICDIDYVGYYEKPLRKFERILDSHVAFAPRSFRAFLLAVPDWLQKKLDISSEIRRELGPKLKNKPVFVEHHEAHAASAFFPSPFEEAAILTLDGVGEWTTASYGIGRGHHIELHAEQQFPHSLGLLYSAFTSYAGFKVNSGEYKLMGLAPYGKPKYSDLILSKLVDLKEDGSLHLDMSYFDFGHGLRMTSQKFHSLFAGEPRASETPVTQKEMDIAASIQKVTEEVVVRSARHVRKETGARKLCLAGGVALNCVANGRLLREGIFDSQWVQPAAGDAGGAVGTCLLIWHQLMGQDRHPAEKDLMQGALLGPSFSDEAIRRLLDEKGAVYRSYDEPELCNVVAEQIAKGKIVGWFQGRMEYGPRALGARSILADPRSSEHRATLNLKVKFRETFRPFAPSVMAQEAHVWFSVEKGHESPYMLEVFEVLDKNLPAITHVDNSARVQTVDEERHGRYYRLLSAFREKTGCPILVNTSFNVRGEPIVCSPGDAYRCFLSTNLDVLVLERQVLLREEQPGAKWHELPPQNARFALD
jgi:carbamoyltransferase